MKTVPLGVIRKSDYTTRIQILVVAWNVGVGVMQNVVLDLPVVDIARQNIDGSTHDFVDPIFVGIRAVIAVVHDVHANARHANTHHDG